MCGSDQQPRVISATIGTDPTIPPEEREAYLQAHASQVIEMKRRIADALFESLIVEGLEQGIQFEDIERLASYGRTSDGRDPGFMRRIIVELMLCLRPKAD